MLTFESLDSPQADDIQGKAVLALIDVGKKDGKLEMGGNRVGDKVGCFLAYELPSFLIFHLQGYFIHPTIFTGVPEDSLINKAEVFGPVV